MIKTVTAALPASTSQNPVAAQANALIQASQPAKALEIATGLQLHIYGRGLQRQKHQDEGFAAFQINIKKHPNEWYTHGEIARIASAKGDFATATKEMNLALVGAPDTAKPGIQGLIARLQKKEDINP